MHVYSPSNFFFLILSILVFPVAFLRHLISVVVNICFSLLARVQFSLWFSRVGANTAFMICVLVVMLISLCPSIGGRWQKTCAAFKAPVTPGLRPGYDLPATEKWANRRKNVRLVAEVVRLVAEVVIYRKRQISRNKVVVMFKTRSHRAYDQVTTYLRSKNVVMMGQS